jgi:proteic killer suppression protein
MPIKYGKPEPEVMEVKFGTKVLDDLAHNPNEKGGFAMPIVKAYRRRIQQIKAAADERDFYALKSLHYEKLKGDRKHQRSMRLNAQMRLILEIEASTPKNIVKVISIEDYH